MNTARRSAPLAHTTRSTAGVLALLLLATLGVRDATAAPTAAQRCAAAKTKASGRLGGGKLGCHAAAAAKGIDVSASCLAAKDGQFARSAAAADAKGGCLGADDAAALSTVTDGVTEAVVAGLRPTPLPDACAKAKLQAAGKKLAGLLGCEAKATLAGVPAGDPTTASCRAIVIARFEKAFAKAESRGGCSTAGDVDAIEALVDTAVADATAQVSVAPSAGTPVAPEEGADVQQVSFTWPGAEVLDSGTGQLDVDVAALRAASGVTSGYLNVRTGAGWVVQNLPVPADFPYDTISTSFQMSEDDGTPVAAMDAQMLLSPEPLSSFAATQSPSGAGLQARALAGTGFSVGTATFNGSGFDEPIGGGGGFRPRAPRPRAVVFPASCPKHTVFQANHSNIEAADDQCWPAASANGAAWLKATYATAVPHPHVLGLGFDGSLVGRLESFMGRPFVNRRVGDPTSIAGGLAGELAYLAAQGLNGLVARHQGPAGNMVFSVPGPDAVYGTADDMASSGYGMVPTAAFLIAEVAAGRSVQMGYLFPGGGGHMVQVVGAGTVCGVPWVAHRSDRDQTNDANGTTGVDFSYLVDSDRDGRLNLVNEATVPNLTLLVSEGVATVPQPCVGCNGRIAFVSERTGNLDIFTMKPDGSDVRQLTTSLAHDDFPSWSGDGTALVFVRAQNGSSELYRMNADGSGQTRLTYTDTGESAPKWSPDGTKIAYAAGPGNVQVWVMNPDGSGQTRLTDYPEGAAWPSWSPDGSKILFTRHDPASDVYVMNADGSGKTNLTNHPAFDGFATWSPDGSKIVFSSMRDTGAVRLWTMNSDGTGTTLLGSSPDGSTTPVWSPDGLRIAFRASLDGNTEIFAINADGTGLTNLTMHPTYDDLPSWQRLP